MPVTRARPLTLLLGVTLLVSASAPSGSAPTAGSFLVASEELQDSNFAATVVLLLEYSEDGARGLVVNRPSKVQLTSLLPIKALRGATLALHYGGPVDPKSLSFLLRAEEQMEKSRPVLDGLQLTGEIQTVSALLRETDGEQRVRAFSGYSGWAPGQLDMELARGSWHVVAARASDVFDVAPGRLWQRLIQKLGGLQASRRPSAERAGGTG